MENLPLYINVIFCLTTIATFVLFLTGTKNAVTTFIILLIWIALQSVVAISGFYTVTSTIPPRFLMLVLPPFLLIISLFATVRGRHFIDGLDLRKLTLLHLIRIPVELVLYWLFLNKKVPELMTFEGRNFDILSGITAPIIYYFGFINKKLSNNIILFWNLICLGLLINIVVNGILSAPLPFQQFAFDQPNIALLYFPFILLPGFIVPIVLFSHLAAIRQLIKMKKINTSNQAI